jgi:hypothetical protein
MIIALMFIFLQFHPLKASMPPFDLLLKVVILFLICSSMPISLLFSSTIRSISTTSSKIDCRNESEGFHDDA